LSYDIIPSNYKSYIDRIGLDADIKSSGTILEEKNEFLEGVREHLILDNEGYLKLEPYNFWTDITPFPSERSHHSMVYDSTHDLGILFGGYDGQYYDDTWIYNYTENSWTIMNPTTRPSRRASTSMVYDSTHDQVILYGGVYIDYNLEEPIITYNELWIYNYSNNAWTKMNPIINPGPRYRHSMVYDSIHDQVILFGGMYANYEINRYVYYNETWIYTYSNNSWTNMNTTEKPSSRYSTSMVYDSTLDCVVLFGGNERYQSIFFGPDPDMKDDTWIYNFTENSWTNMNPLTKPSARDGHSMVYDCKNNQTILFGGWDKNLYDVGDTWIYNYSSNAWINMNPTTKPNAREDHSMIYDSTHNSVILFGGLVGRDVDNSWWFYNYSGNSWSRAIPIPLSRTRHSMTYDSTHNQVILFGGINKNGNLNEETWIYTCSNNSWKNMNPTTKPSARMGHSMVYDSTHDQVILFGGYIGGVEDSDETWIYTYNNNSWKKMDPLIKPSKREDYSMVYDSTHDQVILYGGHSYNPHNTSVIYSETWIYTYNSNSWKKENPLINPSARSGHSMVYDSSHDQVILFGGYDENWQVTDETWIYTYSNNSWNNMNPLTKPSARSGHSMVYDSTHDQVILFGGWYCQSDDAIWIYNYTDNIWTNMHPTVQPYASGGHSIIFDSKDDKVILFGGPKNIWDYSDSIWVYKITDNYFPQGIFDSKITIFEDSYKISGGITWDPIDQPSGQSLHIQVGFSNSPEEEDFLYTDLHDENFSFQGISKFIKYRVIFRSNSFQNNTPLLKSVNITFTLISLYDEMSIPLILGLSISFSLGVGIGIGAILGLSLRKKRELKS